jgi:hypothetical protein
MLGLKVKQPIKVLPHHHLYLIGNPATLLAYRLWHTIYHIRLAISNLQ